MDSIPTPSDVAAGATEETPPDAVQGLMGMGLSTDQCTVTGPVTIEQE